jgi:hypothetical protein
VIGTLVIQGLTLRPLVMALKLKDDGALDGETRAGREEMLRAAFETVETDDSEIARRLRREYADLLRRVDGTGTLSEEARGAEMDLRNRARSAARERLSEMRIHGTIGDSAFQALEQELDMIELDAEIRSRW